MGFLTATRRYFLKNLGLGAAVAGLVWEGQMDEHELGWAEFV
jgi:hypothetical protein